MALTTRVFASSNVKAVKVQPRVAAKATVAKFAQAAGVGLASLALTLAAHADVTVKLGSDTGALVFSPASVTIKSGESVTWVNNVGFPHNVVFDEDEIPAGANADALSHEDYLNAPGQTVSTKFSEAGSYTYYCEPHQGAGMVGKVVVE